MPFVFYVSNSKATRNHNFFDKGVLFVSAPVQWVTVWLLDGVTSVWHSYVALVGVQEENDRLRSENERLLAEVVKREEARIENERLRLLVGLKERAPEVPMRYARVIGTSPTPLFRSIRVNVGERDGVQLGAAVLSADGIVGRVAALSGSYSDVMLLVDANSSTDVLVQRTRARARVRGTGGDGRLGLSVEYLSRTADVEPGDVLVTSGTGEVFPKGLLVGTVMSVERGAFGLYQEARVEPATNFSHLETVMVLAGPWPEDASFEERERAPDANNELLRDGPMLAVPELTPPSPVDAPAHAELPAHVAVPAPTPASADPRIDPSLTPPSSESAALPPRGGPPP